MRAGRLGFTLVELLVALTLLAVGLLGCVGTLLAARRELTDAERRHVAAQSAAGVADSLLEVEGAASGEVAAAWGGLRWQVDPAGIRLVGVGLPGDTLLDWWIPRSGEAPGGAP